MDPILYDIIKAVAPAVIAAILALLSPRIRNWFFYDRTEFDFDYKDDEGSPTWDIQWEDLRLTIQADKVHNDYLEKVRFLVNSKEPGEGPFDVPVSNQFRSYFRGRFQIKLHSVIRTKIRTGVSRNRYRLRWVIRRRRLT